jgi:hypothetical protein
VPTLIEQGLDVVLENWRAVMAPPGLSESDKQALTAVVEKMAHSDSWRATLARLSWTDSYLAGPAFDRFLDVERVRVARIVSRLRGTGSARVGEWVFPFLVLGGVALVMIVLIVKGNPIPVSQPTMSPPVVRMAVGLVSFVALLNLAGFVGAGTVLFACTASAFGSRHWLRDGLVGFALCATVYITFTFGLGVPLPAGALLNGR